MRPADVYRPHALHLTTHMQTCANSSDQPRALTLTESHSLHRISVRLQRHSSRPKRSESCGVRSPSGKRWETRAGARPSRPPSPTCSAHTGR
jgi:hypothetical protein